jgi:hypothetical protein
MRIRYRYKDSHEHHERRKLRRQRRQVKQSFIVEGCHHG